MYNPIACQKVILTNPKIVGINQFHNRNIINGNMINPSIKTIINDSESPFIY